MQRRIIHRIKTVKMSKATVSPELFLAYCVDLPENSLIIEDRAAHDEKNMAATDGEVTFDYVPFTRVKAASYMFRELERELDFLQTVIGAAPSLNSVIMERISVIKSVLSKAAGN
jgi:hypothetical protein